MAPGGDICITSYRIRTWTHRVFTHSPLFITFRLWHTAHSRPLRHLFIVILALVGYRLAFGIGLMLIGLFVAAMRGMTKGGGARVQTLFQSLSQFLLHHTLKI